MSKCRKNLSAWLIVTLVLMCSSLALFADIDRDADKAIRAEQLARTTTYLGATAPGLVLDPAVQAKMEAIAAEESKEAAQLAAEEALALDLQLQAEAKQAALDAEQASAKAFSDAERIWLSNQAPVIKDKPLYTGPHNVEDPMLVKQGGDDIATATVIPSLPYSNTGTTDGYADDYDETCPYNAPGSPDVVYSYSPAANEVVDIDLCASGYDTKVYLYENSHTPGTPYACNDDACPGFRSQLLGVSLTGGNTYYIVIDGYGGEFGAYDLQITANVACAVDCPPGGVAEAEACGGDDNGGCNSTPEVFEAIACGDTVCGTGWADGGSRDTDWFELTLTSDNTVTWSAEAEFPVLIFVIDGNAGCAGLTIISSVTGAACSPVSLTENLAAGTYWLWIGPSDFEGAPPANCPWNYTATVDCTPITTGACCDPSTGGCTAGMTEADCIAAGGDYTPGGSCTPNPCPPPAPTNDDCVMAQEVGDVTDLPYSTTSATNDGLGYTTGPNLWYCYTATCDGDATVSLCGSSYDTKVAAYDGCVCDPLGTLLGSNDDACGLQSEITFPVVAGQQYLVEVGGYSAASGDGLLTISCSTPQPGNPGDDCTDPLKVDIPTLPYNDVAQTTCGRVDDYSSTCLNSYDGGEDIIYEVTVAVATDVDITLDPKGTSWTGVAISDACPPGATCIAQSTSSSGGPHGMTCVHLEPGVYYIMVDTWPSPDCIPDFDLTITAAAGPCGAGNDDCANAQEIGDVVDLPFNTDGTSFDGTGTCMSSPNIWYAYTATCTGDATVSLCGSSYDTKVAAYDACGGTELACNDDACGLQSEITFPVVSGNTYFIEVGGYSSNTGAGLLTVSCALPCVVTCPPGSFNEAEACGVDANGGCNAAPEAFEPIACGDVVCGTAWADGGSRDTDWYELTLTSFNTVTWKVVGAFPTLAFIIDGNAGCAGLSIIGDAIADPCDTAIVTATLGPGTYWVWAGDQGFSGNPCGSGANDYVGILECVPSDPVACAASGGCDEYISRVVVGTIDNSSACDGYFDYTAISTSMDIGTGYAITVENGNGYSSDECGVWVDWNQDTDFDDPGEAIVLDVATGIGPYSGTITPPGDALAGDAVMRIRITWNQTPAPCGADTYGEVEDYTVSVGAGAVAITALDPHPIYAYMAQSVETVPAHAYLGGEFDGGGHSVSEIDLATLSLTLATPGGPVVVPFSAASEVIPSHPLFTGPVCHMTVSLYDMASPYVGLYGTTTWDYTIAGSYSGGGAFAEVGTMTFKGKNPGDLNLDYSVDVVDLTYFIDWMFAGGPDPVDMVLADVNGSGGAPDMVDLTYFVDFLFNGGAAPTMPAQP